MAGEQETSPSLKAMTAFLAYLLSNCRITADGQVMETREEVARVNGVTIRVYPRDHHLPHFHIKAGEEEATFTIDGCELLSGTPTRRTRKIVEYWYAGPGKDTLTETWERTRPGEAVTAEVPPR